jgi:pyridinium-3,5-bisthiocarboxylic acid mononucleotide nickel chelatase
LSGDYEQFRYAQVSPSHWPKFRLSSGDDFKTITVLETTIDDLTPQVMGYVTERLLGAGALEVFVISAQMKKNRPGSLLTVLCRNETDRRMREIIFSETSTLGIRMRQERRDCLERKSVPVTTQWGTVRVKESSLNGLVSNYSPEYDDCRRIAEQQGVPLKQVQQETINTYLALRTPGRKPQVA